MNILKLYFYKQSDSHWQLKIGAGTYIDPY